MPLAYFYRLVLIPFLANSDLVRNAKKRGVLESIGDAAGYLGVDLYGRQPGSITGAFGRQVCTAVAVCCGFVMGPLCPESVDCVWIDCNNNA